MSVGEWVRYQPLAEWLLVNVGLPVLGIALVRACFWLSAIPRGFVDIVKDGQVFFLCVLISASTVHDIWKASGTPTSWVLMPPVAIALVSLVLFGTAVGATSSTPSVSQRRVALASVFLLVFACLIIGLCRNYAGVDHE